MAEMSPVIAAKLAAAGQKLAAGDVRAADALCREVLTAAPAFAEAHYLMGEVALASGDPAKAVASLDHAIALKPAFGPIAAAPKRSR